MEMRRLSLLGAEVDLVTPAEVLDFVARCAGSGRKAIVANHNLHSLHLYARRADMRAFYARADLIEIDSVPMISWARLLGLPVSRAHRSTYLDFREDFWTMATTHDLSVYHLGGAPGVGEAAKSAILQRFPSARIHVRNGFFDTRGADNDAVLADIAQRKPDILLVGMGMPRQELWVLDNLDRLPACVILPVGGAFDYEAGVQYMPPRWTGRLGVEWLARFAANPARLFDRYFVEPWSLLPQILGDVAWTLSGRERMTHRGLAEAGAPWLRRQALSGLTQADPQPVTAEPAPEPVAEPLRAAN